MQVDGVQADYEQLAVAVDGSRIWRGDVTYIPEDVFVVMHADGLIGIASNGHTADDMAQTHHRRYGSNYGQVRVYKAQVRL